MVSIVVLGDAALDVTVVPSGSPEPGGDVPATIRLGIGGQAANVAVRLARRGADVSLASAIADDAAGDLLRSRLAAEGVMLRPLPAERTTMVMALLDPDGERSMLSDRVSLGASGVGTALHGANWVHCSGYALADDASGDAVCDALRRRPDGAVLSVAGGSFDADAAHAARIRGRLECAAVDLLILDRREAANLVEARTDAIPDLARSVAALAPVTIVTAGAAGSVALLDGSLIEVTAASAGRAVDATGAGDAYAAGLIRALHGAWPPGVQGLRSAMEGASALGAQVAARMGAQAVVSGERG